MEAYIVLGIWGLGTEAHTHSPKGESVVWVMVRKRQGRFSVCLLCLHLLCLKFADEGSGEIR